jgi:hypothetical protein
MENKYYHPTLDEFHVGFEYEYLCCENIHHPEHWFATTFEGVTEYDDLANNTLLDIKEIIERGNEIRVKYLDEEDIESLGFINWTVEWTDPARYYFTKSLLDGSESIKKGIQLYFIFGSYDRDHVLIYNITDEIKHILFDGVIKNKSEFKKLLKQLSI